ncbi:hypothetical protein D3C83_209880 [compost metagenome]
MFSNTSPVTLFVPMSTPKSDNLTRAVEEKPILTRRPAGPAPLKVVGIVIGFVTPWSVRLPVKVP